ncbi:MAG: glutamine--tRNA ligase, partial [Candidatus Shikimatogenerans bostrichidophilus]
KKKIKWINIKNKKIKNRILPFTRNIYIEKNDFKNNNNKNFYRLNLNNYVRLKYYNIIKIYKIIKKKKKIKKIY